MVAVETMPRPVRPKLLEKPRLRGVSHEIAFYAAIGAGAMLVAMSPSPRARIATLVYSLCLAALFGISALYHRPHWQPVARQRMRRLDHAAIFLLISGSYTPLALLIPTGGHSAQILIAMWVGAAAGIVQAVFWVHAPKALTAVIYVVLGWAVFAHMALAGAALGTVSIGLLVAAGVIYTLGAVTYALRRPDPIPTVFGYHEIFHALVIVASVCLFIMIARVVKTYG